MSTLKRETTTERYYSPATYTYTYVPYTGTYPTWLPRSTRSTTPRTTTTTLKYAYDKPSNSFYYPGEQIIGDNYILAGGKF